MNFRIWIGMCLVVSLFSPLVAWAEEPKLPEIDAEVVRKLVHERQKRKPSPLLKAVEDHLSEADRFIQDMEVLNESSEESFREPIRSAKRKLKRKKNRAARLAAKVNLLESKEYEFDGLKKEFRKRFRPVRDKLVSLGLTQKVEEWDRFQQKVDSRFERVRKSLKDVRKATTKKERRQALKKARAELRKLRRQNRQSNKPLNQAPVPTWTYDKSPLQPPVIDHLITQPKYLSEFCSPTRNVYAELGDAQFENPELTPEEAAVCSYTAADLAETPDIELTQEIRDLARQLQYSPAKIYNYVANEIGFEPYQGSLKGAMGTLVSGSGNPTDQASLLIALLRASNIPAQYVKGVVRFEGDPRVLDWTGAKSYRAAAFILANGRIAVSLNESTNVVQMNHVWVQACLPYAHYRGVKSDNAGHRWIPLDPSFENKEYQDGIVANLSFDYDAYLAKRTKEMPHEAFEDQAISEITSLPPAYANNTIEDVPYKGTKVPLKLDILPVSLPYEVVGFTDWGGGINSSETASLPDSHRIKFSIDAKNSSGSSLAQVSLSLPGTILNRTTLSFEGATAADQTALTAWQTDGNMESSMPCTINVVPVIRSESNVVAQGTTSLGLCSESNQLTLTVSSEEVGEINRITYNNIHAAGLHALQAYGFQASNRLLADRAAKLISTVRNTADPNTNLEETEGEFLHLVGLKYMRHISDSSKRVGSMYHNSGENGNHLGLTTAKMKVEYLFDLPFAVNRAGFLIDVPGGQDRGVDLTTGDLDFEYFELTGYAMSAYESYIWQENAQLDAVSTVRGLQFANEMGIEVLTLDSSNWAAHSSKFTSNADASLNYSSAAVNDLKINYIDQGYSLRIPRSLIRYDNWTGRVFAAGLNTGSLMAGAYIIGGDYAGGYTVGSTQPASTYNPVSDSGYQSTYTPPSSSSGSSSWSWENSSPINSTTFSNGYNPHVSWGGDPVNLATGNLYHVETDLGIPGRGGLALVFERSYNSRGPEDGPMGHGWTHSFNHYLTFNDDNANSQVDSGDSDGVTSSATWTDGSGGTKFFTVTGNSSGVPQNTTFGNPDGVYMTVKREGDGTYTIREKGGVTYTFESMAGTVDQVAMLTKIEDRNGNQITLSYTNGKLAEVKDGLNRALTFTYTGKYLTSVQDWTGRQVQYQFIDGDLTAVLSPLAVEGKQAPKTYTYYTTADGSNLAHKLKAFKHPRGNGMTFEYYANGKVFRHTDSLGHSMTFRYNDYRRETVTINERGFTRTSFFDKSGNPEKVIAENGAENSYEYEDPNDPMLRTKMISPMGLTTLYDYDSNGNVIRITQPSGATVEYSNFNAFGAPGKVKDLNGNYTLYKFDANGNTTDVFRLKSGFGASIDPATYTPNASELVAWSQRGYDSYGNTTAAKQVRNVATLEGPSVSTTFDGNGLYPVSTERCGDKDGDGQVSDDPCDTAALVYDSLGRLEQGVNGRWEAIEADYDSLGRIVRSSDSYGQLRDYFYDDNGNRKGQQLVVDNGGVLTLVDQSSATYDLADRMETKIDAGGFVTRYKYDELGNVIETISPDNYRIGFKYDANNHMIEAFDAEGHKVKRELDLLGRTRKVTDPNGNSTTYEYYHASKEGRLHKQIDAVGREVVYDYDASGNVVTVTDNLGRVTTTTYDELNRPVRIVQPDVDSTSALLHPITTYRYDTLGNLVEVKAGHNSTDPNNPSADVLVTQALSTFDDFGRKLTETDPLGATWRYTYDVHGNLERIEDPKGQIVERDFDYGGLIREQRAYVSVSDPNPHVIEYTYNELGQTVSVTAPEASYQYKHDNAHRLTQVTDLRGNKSLSYAYSPGGMLNSMADSEDRETDYIYDDVGRLTGIWTPDFGFVTFAYDAGGRLTEQSYPNGVNSQFTWNADNTLAQLKTRLGQDDSQIITQHDYTYDQVGNRDTHIEKIGATTTPYKYVYDALNRLSEVRNNTTDALMQGFTYDAVGNRTSRTDGTDTWYYSYDNANQLEDVRQGSVTGPLTAGFVYDANGNQTQKCEGGTVTRSASACSGDTVLAMQYDPLDRLYQADKTGLPTENYSYDHQDRRVRKEIGGTGTDYHYAGPDIYAEYGSNWAQATAYYTHGLGLDSPLIRHEGSSAQYYHQDGLGSVVAKTDAAGAVLGTQRFDAFGQQVGTTGTVAQYGYTGREPDATGLIYYRARYYDPSVGRFTQRDPLGFVDGVNRYAYVMNSPVNFVDPWGTDSRGSTSFTTASGYSGASSHSSISSSPGAGPPGTFSQYGPSQSTIGYVAPNMHANNEVGKAFVEIGVGLTPAGIYADFKTAATGKTITGDVEESTFFRYAGIVPFVSELRKLFKTGDAISTAVKAAEKVPTTRLYHGGNLRNGRVGGHKSFSTTPDREYAELYAEMYGGTVYEFEVPTKRLYELKGQMKAQDLTDAIKDTPYTGPEVRFDHDVAEELNQYRR